MVRAVESGQSIVNLLLDPHREIRLLLLRAHKLGLSCQGGLLLLVHLLLVLLIPSLHRLKVTRDYQLIALKIEHIAHGFIVLDLSQI